MLKYSDGDLTVTLTDTGTVTFSNAASSLPAATATTTVTTTEAPPVLRYPFYEETELTPAPNEAAEYFRNEQTGIITLSVYFEYNGFFYFDDMWAVLGFTPVEVSTDGIRCTNATGDTIEITPIQNTYYPDETKTDVFHVVWRAGGAITEWDNNLGLHSTTAACYSGVANNYPIIESYHLITKEMLLYYCPNGYELPNGAYITPDMYR